MILEKAYWKFLTIQNEKKKTIISSESLETNLLDD